MRASEVSFDIIVRTVVYGWDHLPYMIDKRFLDGVRPLVKNDCWPDVHGVHGAALGRYNM